LLARLIERLPEKILRHLRACGVPAAIIVCPPHT
jgi:hypothetical protein